MSGNTERDKAEPLPQNRKIWWMADVFIQLPSNTDDKAIGVLFPGTLLTTQELPTPPHCLSSFPFSKDPTYESMINL